MNKKYDEIMDKIEVTEEMRQRILKNIQETDMSEHPKGIRFPKWKRYISIAACFAVIFVGTLTVTNFLNQLPVQSDPPIAGVQAIEECASMEELSTAVGFPIEGLSDLPFEIDHAIYTSYWNELAQIEYYGSNGQTALYRKSTGTDDNSGNYNSFEDVTQATIDGMSATLKGTDGAYSLAWWTDGVYAYSVCLSEGVSQSIWETIISGE